VNASPSAGAAWTSGTTAGTSGTTAGRRARAAAIGALQAALAAEHAAVYGYGVAGAHLAGTRQAAAIRYWAAHQAARDTLAAMVVSRGATPVAASTGYRLPFAVHGEQSAIALAAFLEDRVTAAYLTLVALTDTKLRLFGARGMQTAALRAAWWRGQTLAFPGLEVPVPGPVAAGAGGGQPSPGQSATGGTSPTSPPTGPAGG
jgi:hypothetical protein